MIWIKCTKRLPDKQGEYLVYSTSDPRLSVKTIPYLGKGCFALRATGSKQKTYEKEFRDGFYIESIFAPNVTHWMPLPDEPCEELEK